MPHERHQSSSGAKPKSRAVVVLSNLSKDVKALNSSILVISQKINYIVRNEKILGRNILVVNKKIKEIEAGKAGSSLNDTEQLSKQLTQIQEQLDQNTAQISELYSAVDRIKDSSVKVEQFKELKYVIDSINPLEFVTYKDIEQLIEEKIASKSKKTKK